MQPPVVAHTPIRACAYAEIRRRPKVVATEVERGGAPGWDYAATSGEGPGPPCRLRDGAARPDEGRGERLAAMLAGPWVLLLAGARKFIQAGLSPV
jgi:hypothetical protein